jgi:hypothetical protein
MILESDEIISKENIPLIEVRAKMSVLGNFSQFSHLIKIV